MLVPLLTLRHVEPAGALAPGAFGSTGRSGSAGRVLLVVQVAFTVALVACAIGFTATISALRAVPIGFQADGLINARLAPLPGGERLAGSPTSHAELLEKLGAVPGLRAVAVTGQSSLFGFVQRSSVVGVGQPDQPVEAQVLQVSDGFFTTLQLPLIAGTSVPRDGRSDGPTAVVSRSVAERLFGAADATGRYVRVGTATQPVCDRRHRGGCDARQPADAAGANRLSQFLGAAADVPGISGSRDSHRASGGGRRRGRAGGTDPRRTILSARRSGRSRQTWTPR